MVGNLLIIIFFFLILFLQLFIVINLNKRSKDILQLVHKLQKEVDNLMAKDKKPAKINTPLKENIKKTPDEIKDEKIIFHKEMKLNGKEKLIEMNIETNPKSK